MVDKNLLKNMESGTLILTANRRLAAYLQNEYALYQRQANINVWPSLKILPLQSWLVACWQEMMDWGLDEPRMVLTTFQEQLLWESIINDSAENSELLSVTTTAQAVQQAWKLCKLWKLKPSTFPDTVTEECAAFATWARQFQTLCQSHQWIDESSIPSFLISLIETQKFKPPTKILLYGFIETLPPLYQHLVNVLITQGCNCQQLMPDIPAKTITYINPKNTEEEIVAMAHWAGKQLKQKKARLIGCVIPNLQQLRATVENIFIQVLAPQALLPYSTASAVPFNITMGQSLENYPLIHTALLLLRIAHTELPFAQLSHIIRSPFIGHAEIEFNSRAKLDAKLRSYGQYQIPLDKVISEAVGCQAFMLAKKFQNYLSLQLSKKEKLPPSKWAAMFTKQLTTLGWPGTKNLDSQAFQLHARWQQLLSEFAGLDIIFATLSGKTALDYLCRMASHSIFQPKTTHKPIQILGVLEAISIEFDELWVSGLHDGLWPAPPAPNPFIPLALQKQLNMPNASAHRELQFSQSVTALFCQSAHNLIFSSPQQEEDRTLQPSPLLKKIANLEYKPTFAADKILYVESLLQSQVLETIVDFQGPMLDNTKIQGNSYLFKLQAACPFRAFAEVRLGAKRLEEPYIGLDARDRGTLMHKVLENLWLDLKDQQHLCQLNSEELDKLIEKIVATTFASVASRRPIASMPRLAHAEKIRLKKLLGHWLEIEKARPFFQVVAIEKSITASLANITLNLRVDRVDQLSDGTQLLIDYKTGRVSTADWFGERPDDPQLPLYSILHPTPIAGLVFAQLRANKMGFVGKTALLDQLPGIDTLADWEAQLTEWHRVLTALGQQFYNGYAKVDPKKDNETCQQCDLQTLCRIAELRVKKNTIDKELS